MNFLIDVYRYIRDCKKKKIECKYGIEESEVEINRKKYWERDRGSNR